MAASTADVDEANVPTKSEPERPSINWLVKEVLDKLCLDDKVRKNKEGSDEESLEKRCQESCKKRVANKAVAPVGVKCSFEDHANRLAHTYLHFAKNAYIVNGVLSDAYSACTHLPSGTTVFNEFMSAVSWGRCSVFSLAGGPGDDILGVLMFLHRHGLRTKVTAGIAEKCGAWERTMNSFYKAMNVSDQEGKATQHEQYLLSLWKKLDGGIKYYKADMKNRAQFLQPYSPDSQAMAQADLVLLPFVMTSLPETDDIASALQSVLECIKPGALVVFIDHVRSKGIDLINDLSYWCGLRRIYFMSEISYDLPRYEKKDYLSHYKEEFGAEPVRQTKVCTIVFKRPSCQEFDRRGKMTDRERKNIQQGQQRLRKVNPSLRFFSPS